MKIKVVDIENNEIDALTLSNNKERLSYDGIYQLGVFYLRKRRAGTASTKTRSEVAITGAKAYKQKGTGSARRGRNSTPLRRGGAVAFGPRPRSYTSKLNKKHLKLAFNSLVNACYKKITVLDESTIKTFKTKKAAAFIKENSKKNSLVILDYSQVDLYKMFSNIANVRVNFSESINPILFSSVDNIVFSKKSFKYIKDTLC